LTPRIRPPPSSAAGGLSVSDDELCWQVLGYEHWLPRTGTVARDLWPGALAWIDTHNQALAADLTHPPRWRF
jgi:hypothetical protein